MCSGISHLQERLGDRVRRVLGKLNLDVLDSRREELALVHGRGRAQRRLADGLVGGARVLDGRLDERPVGVRQVRPRAASRRAPRNEEQRCWKGQPTLSTAGRTSAPWRRR